MMAQRIDVYRSLRCIIVFHNKLSAVRDQHSANLAYLVIWSIWSTSSVWFPFSVHLWPSAMSYQRFSVDCGLFSFSLSPYRSLPHSSSLIPLSMGRERATDPVGHSSSSECEGHHWGCRPTLMAMALKKSFWFLIQGPASSGPR